MRFTALASLTARAADEMQNRSTTTSSPMPSTFAPVSQAQFDSAAGNTQLRFKRGNTVLVFALP
ncbi:hypothetical protein K788_0001154 (plasmid) [Paraburkholderia caribensis MBA4]|uniref:Uncharacterized protein n=1 Tax=Paraburkholderia caribensis MBA4 TaxID=1323664 RepID=A0A0N7JVY5_9BURK|nr:hypothetical protein K788_0001154 [Paraburkholderia caribensis MBA4]